tara:strand:- start:7 stop:192 length:186 start_codon:yes stop_codon:yes gene_type:complete
MARDINSKMDRIVILNREPIASEGSEGDLTVRSTRNGLKLCVKFKNKWHCILMEDGIEIST